MSSVVTIREAVERAKTEGYPVSEYALRQWVNTGAVPVRRIGQKALLYYPNLIKYLQCEGGADIPAAQEPVIPGVRMIKI